MAELHLSEREVYVMLNAEDGPVGRMLHELSEQAADVARAAVPVRRANFAQLPDWYVRRSTAYPPAYTLASIRAVVDWDEGGLIYGGVNAAKFPTIFLEKPAEQMHRRHAFLSTALDWLEANF